MPEVEIDGIGTVVFPEDMSLADIQQESARLYDNHSAYSTGVQPSALVSRQAQEMMPPSIREAMNRGAQAPLQQQITQGAARSMGPVYERNQQEAQMRQLQRSPEPVEGAADWSISDVADVVEPVLRPWASTPENPLGGFASAVRPVGQAINELGDEAVGIYQGVANSYGLQTGSVDREVVKALPGIAAAMTGAGTLSRLGLAESLAAPVAFGGVPFAQTLAATDDTFAAVKAGSVGTLIPGTAEVGRAMAAKTLGSLVERGILGTGATAAGNMGQKAVEALGAQGAIQVFMEGMNLPEYVAMEPEERKAALLHNLAVNSAFLMMDVPGVFGRSTSRTRQGRSETLWEAKKTGMKPAAKVGELLESLVNDPEFTARLTRLADEFALEQMNPRNAQLQAQAPEIANVEPRFIDPEREPLRGVELEVESLTEPAAQPSTPQLSTVPERPAPTIEAPSSPPAESRVQPVSAPEAKAPEAARPVETLTPEQMREQRTRYWTGIKRGLIETDAGGTVRLIESSSKPGHFDVWHTLDGKRELVGEAEKPRRLQAAQDYAVQFALKQGGKVADAPVAPESSEGDLVRGDRFRDGEGKQFEVWKNRQGTIWAHPVVDGKPLVNRESTVRFSVTPEARARNPEDRVFGAAPADPAPETPVQLKPTGRPFTAATPVQGTKVSGHYDLVEAPALVTSFDAGYEAALQPRDRTRAASANQIADIVLKFDPNRLGESPTTDLGAPMVDELGQVLSGNGRSTALRTLYDAGKGDVYKDWLLANAKQYGLDPAVVQAMERPVLVRRVSDYGEVNKVEFARQSNQQQILGMGEAEKAGADAKLLANNPEIFNLFSPSEDGNVLAASNREFLNAFIKGTGDGAELLSAEGYNIGALTKRVKNAILGSYLGTGDQRLLSAVIESAGDLGIKNVVDGVMASAPTLVRFKGTAYDVTENIHQALKDLVSLKSTGTKLEDFLEQSDLLGSPLRTAQSDALLKFFYETKSIKQVNETLQSYAKQAKEALADSQSGGLFGEAASTRIDILNRIYGKSQSPFEGKANQPAPEPAKPSAADSKRPESKAAPVSAPEVAPPVAPPKAPAPLRPLTKAESAELAELVLKKRGERDRGGAALDQAEVRRYNELTARAGQADLLAGTGDNGTAGRVKLLREKAAEMERLRKLTLDRFYAADNQDTKRRLVLEMEQYTKAVKEAMESADALEAGARAKTEDAGDMFGDINTGNLGELGMGGAKPTEFTAGAGTPTSIKNATVDAERSKRGLPPAMEAGRRTWGEVWERAMAIIDQDPAAQNVLIAQLKAQPRALTDIEDALLLHRQIDLQNQYGRQTRELATAYDDAKNFPGRLEAVERFKVMVQETSKDLFELYEVGKAAGTETGRGLAARKMLADEHFELAQMEMEKREAREGAPLTDAERAELTQAHDTIQRLQAEFAAAEARHEAAAADRRAAEATEDLKQAAKADPDYNPVVIKWAERIVDKLERTGKEAEAQWKQMMARTLTGVDPTLLAVAIKIGAGKIARKAMPFAEWAQTMVDAVGESIRPYLQPAWDKLGERIDKVATDIAGRKKAEALKKVRVVDEDARRERLIGSITEAAGEDRPLDEIGTYVRRLALQFVKDGISDRNRLVDAVHSVLVNHFDPAITRREAMDAISGYGDFKPLDPDAAKRTLRDLKGQLQSVAKLEDIVGRRPLLKTGVERRAPSDEERRLIQQVNEAKRVHGVVTTDPARQLKGAQDAILTRLKHQIADLNFQIDAGARTVKGGSKVASTPEMDGLRHARNELRKRLDELLPRPGISEAQRIATAERGLAADIELYEFKIAARETGPLRGKSARLNSAKLDQLRARRDVLKAELAELRAAAGHTQAKRLADLVARSEQLAQRINAGEIATVKPPTRAESPAMTAARAEHKQLVEMMAKLRKAATGETKELHSLEQRSAELARRINEGDISRPAKVKVAGSPELEAARAEHKQLVKALNELRRAAEASPEERAMATLNRRIATEYAKVMDRIARSDYAPRRRREVPPMDAATAAAKGRLDQAKTDWRRGLVAEQRRNRSLAEKGWDAAKEVAHAQRQIWTSIDLSALLRQGGLVVAGHPIRGLKSTPAMLRALSETQFNAEWARVQARPNWSRYQRAKLYLSNPHETTITKLEEEVRSRWLQNVPGIKQSNQTYTTFLNKLRADSFDAMVSTFERKGPSLTDAELRGIANYINIATGRGDFGKLAGAADTLAIGFFSPRLLLSRFQYIMGQPLYKAGSWRVRRQIAAEYARTLAGFAVVLALGLIAGAKIETDPTSSDFLKLRFGNTRVDLGAGILQPLVYLARTIRGEKKTPDGKRVPIRGAVPFGGDDWADVTLNFGRSKFSPAMGTTWDLISGKNVVGEKVTLGSAAELFFIPLSFREVGKTMQDQGVPAGTVMRVLGLLGAGVNTYDSDEKSRKVVGALMKEIRGGTPEQREAIRQRLTEALKK